jgi:hypothetical protein
MASFTPVSAAIGGALIVVLPGIADIGDGWAVPHCRGEKLGYTVGFPQRQ